MNNNTLLGGLQLQGGKYRIKKVLGQGGFGITYEAEQVSLGRKVAVKEFFMKDLCNRDASTSHVSVPSVGSKELVEKFRQKFIREARTIAALDHEHIVRIHDVFEENGTAYYVMEYLGGGSLDRIIRECGALSEEKAVDYIRQISDALQYIHSRSILHFDVKPSNVLLSENGIAKLIDFGISKHYDESGSQTSSTPVGISKGFAPLEQYQQGGDIKTFTPATDIYALGATLYVLVVGNNPPEASVVNEDGVPYIDRISASVMHTIECAMQPKRKNRPQSVPEFLRLLDGSKISSTPDGTTQENDSDETTVIKDQLSQDRLSKTNNGGGNGGQKQAKGTNSGFPKWLYAVGAAVIAVLIVLFALRKPTTNPDVPDVPEELVAEMTGQQAVQSQSIKKEQQTFVDLGLSVLWAHANFGAQYSYEQGQLFRWQEKMNEEQITAKGYPYGAFIPSKNEVIELRTKCKWEYITINNVQGYQVTGPNGNNIFLPAYFTHQLGGGDWGYYWTTSESKDKTCGYCLYFNKYSSDSNGIMSRDHEMCVRLVCPK